jgi:hypothetical protein
MGFNTKNNDIYCNFIAFREKTRISEENIFS